MKEFVMCKMDLPFEGYVEGDVHYHVDRHYGADADGNRATRKTFVESVDHVVAYDDEGGEVALSKEQAEEAADLLVNKFMEGGY